MTLMAGRTNPPRDQHGLWRAACLEFADELGWKRKEIWSYFEEFACIREIEMRLPRPLAEHLAFGDVKAMFDKRGEGFPN